MSQRPWPASLVIRMGEAADGYRDGIERWFVVSYAPPHDLRVFLDRGEAEAARDGLQQEMDAAGAGEVCEVFGPFATEPDPGPFGPKAGVASIAVTVRRGDEEVVVPIDPRKYDSIFWSLSAVDKFAIPYYVGMSGLDFATSVREKFVGNEVFLMGHMPNSTYAPEFLQTREEIGPPGILPGRVDELRVEFVPLNP